MFTDLSATAYGIYLWNDKRVSNLSADPKRLAKSVASRVKKYQLDVIGVDFEEMPTTDSRKLQSS